MTEAQTDFETASDEIDATRTHLRNAIDALEGVGDGAEESIENAIAIAEANGRPNTADDMENILSLVRSGDTDEAIEELQALEAGLGFTQGLAEGAEQMRSMA